MDKKARKNKSDTGIIDLFNTTLTTVFGIPTEVSDEMFKLVKRRGVYAQMKSYVKSMDVAAHKRINSAIDMIEEKLPEPEETPEQDKAGEKEEVKESFISYLLSEVTAFDIADSEMRSMGADKAERVTKAKQNDASLRRTLATKQQELEKSEDPIDRQIAQLERRIATLRNQKESQAKRNAQ